MIEPLPLARSDGSPDVLASPDLLKRPRALRVVMPMSKHSPLTEYSPFSTTPRTDWLGRSDPSRLGRCCPPGRGPCWCRRSTHPEPNRGVRHPGSLSLLGKNPDSGTRRQRPTHRRWQVRGACLVCGQVRCPFALLALPRFTGASSTGDHLFDHHFRWVKFSNSKIFSLSPPARHHFHQLPMHHAAPPCTTRGTALPVPVQANIRCGRR